MNRTLATALDKLRSAPSNVAAYSVQHIFSLLETTHPLPRDVSIAFQSCMEIGDKEVAEVALAGVKRLVDRQGISVQDAIDILAANVFVADPTCAQEIISNLMIFGQMECESDFVSQPWEQDSITRVLMARPEIGSEVLTSAIRLILLSSREEKVSQCISSLYPCLSYILLSPSFLDAENGQSMAAVTASCLHSRLIRLACNSHDLRDHMLNIVLRLLTLYRTTLAANRAWVLPALADIIDVMECMDDDEEARGLISRFSLALMTTSQELAIQGLPLVHTTTALARLHSLDFGKSCLGDNIWELGLLSLQAAGRDRSYTLALICGALCTLPQATITKAAHGMLTICGITATVHALPCVRAQGVRLLQQLKNISQPSKELGADQYSCPQATHLCFKRCANQAMMFQARIVLERLLEPGRLASEDEACQWLSAFCSSLTEFTRQQEAKRNAATSKGRWSPLLLQDTSAVPEFLSLPLLVISASLLGHPSFKVQCMASRTMGSIAQVFPLCAPSLLSLLLFNLKKAVERLCSGRIPRDSDVLAARSCLHHLSAIPSLATSRTAIGSVLAALKPLTAPGVESDNLQCIAMRMLVHVWKNCRRVWPTLRTLLLPSSHGESRMLRLTRASCVRDICKVDGNRGIELVKPIEEALRDGNPGVAALGLEAIAHLCESDHIEFYAAWRVVIKIYPTVPGVPVVASRWIALLAFGALDALVHPDAAIAVIELLWRATNHDNHQVRLHAYDALTSFPIMLLESLEMEYSIQDYTAPVLFETDDRLNSVVVKLASMALAHEYSRRRRQAGAQGNRRAAMAVGSLVHKMTRTLPRQLCEKRDLADIGVSSAALLLCYLPMARPGGQRIDPKSSEKNAVTESSDLLNGYIQIFRDICESGTAGAGPGNFEGFHACAMIGSWTEFLGRWMAAARASKATELSKELTQKVTSVVVSAAAANDVWNEIYRVWKLEENFLASDCAVLAAGSLASWLGPQQPSVVSQCVIQLKEQLQSNRRPSSQRIACLALGVAITGLHPTEWHTWKQASDLLHDTMKASPNGPVRAAAVQAIGLMVGSLDAHASVTKEDQSERSLRETRAVKTFVETIMCEAVCLAQQPLIDILRDAYADAPLAWDLQSDMVSSGSTAYVVSSDLEDEQAGFAMAGLWHAFALSAPAIWRQGGKRFLKTLFHGLKNYITTQLSDFAKQPDSQNRSACQNLGGALRALPIFSEPLLKGEMIEEEDVRSIITVICSTAQNKNEKLSTTTSSRDLMRAAMLEALGELSALLADCGVTEDMDSVADMLLEGLKAQSPSLQASAAMASASLSGAAVWTCSTGRNRRPARHHLMMSSTLKEETATRMKTLLSVLEEMALKCAEPRVKKAATWATAMICAHARKGLRISGDDVSVSSDLHMQDFNKPAESMDESGVFVPLHTLPQDGAMWALIDGINSKGIQAKSAGEMACAVGVLQSLAQADRLPVMHWGSICRRLMRISLGIVNDANAPDTAPDASIVKQKVRAACVQLLLKHGHRTNLGLGDLAEDLLEQQRFESLEDTLKVELLTALPALISSLSEERAAAVVSALPTLTATSSGTSKVELATWEGLSAYCSTQAMVRLGLSTPHATEDILVQLMTNALIQTLSEMVRRLPKEPTWHAGQWREACACKSEESAASNLWDAAIECLSHVPSQTAVSVLHLSPNDEYTIKACFIRCQMAQRGKLNHREVNVCKTVCIDGLGQVGSRNIALAVASAFISAPQAVQEQSFRDALNTVSQCPRPMQAFELVACMAAVFSACAQQDCCGAPGDQVLSCYSVDAAVQTMPYCLSLLLSLKLWKPVVGIIAEQLLIILKSTNTYLDDFFHSQADEVIKSCLVALRQHLSTEVWQYLATAA